MPKFYGSIKFVIKYAHFFVDPQNFDHTYVIPFVDLI